MSESSLSVNSEFPDVPTFGTARGRAVQLNPANRFETISLHVLGEARDELFREHPQGRQIATQVFDDDTQSVLNRVDSPDLPMSWTLNPYRGCEHGCVYCYARPGHEYFGLSCGLDFETKIFAKPRAPELLRRELANPSWKGECISMSGVTDPYQPVERDLEISRRCLEVMAECRQPVTIITKNALVTRDLDLFAKLNAHRAVGVAISLTTLDNKLASAMEPRASSPQARLRAMRELSSAGIPVIVMTAPIIPNLNDHELPALLEAAADAGATRAGYVLLRLPYQIKALFLDWLERIVPGRAAHVESLIRQSHGGKLYRAEFFHRGRGEGAFAKQINQTFKVFARKFKLDRRMAELNSADFRRPLDLPGGVGQLGLFG